MKNDKEFLTNIGFDMSESIHWLIVINDNLMRYSFDTVQVNTHVRGGNTCLSTLHGLLVVLWVKDFPKLSSSFNITLISS